MSRIPTVDLLAQQPDTADTRNDFREVDVDQFLQLMIAELQNQDPLAPLENSDLIQQISQIREIGATDQLTETLQAVVTGQNLTTASNLIGKQVNALSDEGETVEGVVDRVSINVNNNSGDRSLKIHVGEQSFDVGNIRDVSGV